MPRAIRARQTADPDNHKSPMLLVAGAAVAIPGLSASAARADEGLWTFDNFPAAAGNYEKIAGWAAHDHTVPPFTDFKGPYERATGEPPFQLSQS